MNDLDVAREIRRILRDQLRVEPPDPGTDLLESGLLDSLGFVELVASLESTFDIVVSLVDLELDEFRTVASITRFVRGQIEPKGAAGAGAANETAPSTPVLDAPRAVAAEAG